MRGPMTAAEVAERWAALPKPTKAQRKHAAAVRNESSADRERCLDVSQQQRIEDARRIIDDPDASEAAKWAARENLDCAEMNRRYAFGEGEYRRRAQRYRMQARHAERRQAARASEGVVLTAARTEPRTRARRPQRRPGSSSRTSSADPGGGDPDPAEPPVDPLRLAPIPRAVLMFVCLTAAQCGVDIEQVEL